MIVFGANRFSFAASDIGLCTVHKKWFADRYVLHLIPAGFMQQSRFAYAIRQRCKKRFYVFYLSRFYVFNVFLF